MRESTKESPFDRGELKLTGRCQICGQDGTTIAIPGAPAPNQFCERCAIEYSEALASDADVP